MTKNERDAAKEVGKVGITPGVYELLEISLEAVGQIAEDQDCLCCRCERHWLYKAVHVEWAKSHPVNQY